MITRESEGPLLVRMSRHDFTEYDLRALFGEVRDTDEIEHCRSAGWTWSALMGREFFALYRDGKLISSKLVCMN